MFPKIVVPPNHPLKNRVFHHKPSILGYPYFWNHIRIPQKRNFIIPRTSSGWFFWLNAFRLFFLTDSMFFARCPFLCLNWFLQFPVTFSSWLCITASMHNIPQDHRKMWFRVFSPDLCLFVARIMGFSARFFEGFFWYLFKSLSLMCCNHSEASIAAELLFLPEWGVLPGFFFLPENSSGWCFHSGWNYSLKEDPGIKTFNSCSEEMAQIWIMLRLELFTVPKIEGRGENSRDNIGMPWNWEDSSLRGISNYRIPQENLYNVWCE